MIANKHSEIADQVRQRKEQDDFIKSQLKLKEHERIANQRAINTTKRNSLSQSVKQSKQSVYEEAVHNRT
jgi:hypothetical protein